jgi:hypothetical protein
MAVKDRQGTFIHVLDGELPGAERPEKSGKGKRTSDQRNGDNDNGNREQGHGERCV